MIKKNFQFLLLALLSLVFLAVVVPTFYFYFKQDPEKLYAAIDNSNKIVITKVTPPTGPLEIFESNNIVDIQSFKQSLKLEKNIEFSHSSCRGYLFIDLFNNDNHIARIAYLHDSIRVDDITDVGTLSITDEDLLNHWFSERNITIESRLDQ